MVFLINKVNNANYPEQIIAYMSLNGVLEASGEVAKGLQCSYPAHDINKYWGWSEANQK